ncbi:transposase [Pontibacter toksunensis]|uniref:Transposase n=1 Tax=Pontibacter toksunensis TaxID=1332631 RepID=A0ABW6C3T8_9BACT
MVSQAEQKVAGIDVSKETLAVCHLVDGKAQHLETDNNKAGFKLLVKRCGAGSLYVMEATGAYYMHLAYCLHGQGATIAVINPVSSSASSKCTWVKARATRKMPSGYGAMSAK